MRAAPRDVRPQRTGAVFERHLPSLATRKADRFPVSPRVQRWKAPLAKPDPEPPAEPYSPPG